MWSVEHGVIFQPFSSRSSNFSLLWKQIEIEVDRSFEVGQQSDLFYSSPNSPLMAIRPGMDCQDTPYPCQFSCTV